MKALLRKSWLPKVMTAGVVTLACAHADAQSSQSYAPTPTPAATTPAAGYRVSAPLNADESFRFKQAVDAAQAGDINQARALQSGLANSLARRVVQWAMINSAGSMLSFFDLDAAKRELWDWPRAARRQIAAEKAIELVGLSPQRVVEWFGDKEPTTAEGMIALISAQQQLGRQEEAQTLARRAWREKVFEADAQGRFLARYGIFLTSDDHAKRLDLLLYGPQGPAARAMLDLVSPDVRALAEARIALRANRDDANQLLAQVPAQLANHAGLAFERARYLRRRNLDGLAAALVPSFPAPPPGFEDAAELMWAERRALLSSLLRSGNPNAAYIAATNHGLPHGVDFTEAEFFAGWISLTKLRNPAQAETHFANILKAGTSPITVSRAWYWRGRAAEARGDAAAAQQFWREGGKYITAFYGQLSAERAGIRTIALPAEPQPNESDRARFEGRDLVRAARMLADAGERDLFRSFVLAIEDDLPTAAELALLVDMARLYGDQDLAMRVVRAGATRGLYLPERGYPVRTVPQGFGNPEPALVHAIIRQESGFDPGVRSGVGARGMMQLMPATAQAVSRKLGLAYSADRLGDPDYNMRLGSAYLGELVGSFSGSYLMAAAGYNAGPGRSTQWASECGDPRSGTTDPSDFIECISFSETRNYVMRIMEGVQVYRARLNGGAAPLSLMADLKRGGWSPSAMMAAQPAQSPASLACNAAPAQPQVGPLQLNDRGAGQPANC